MAVEKIKRKKRKERDMGDVNWSETKAILLELEQLFKRDDDVNDIDDIKKMSKEIDLIYENNLKSTKELIKDMTARVAEKEKDIIAPSEAMHASNLENFVSEKENIDGQIEKLHQQMDSKRENIATLALNSLNYRTKANDFAAAIAKQDTRTAYALSLYTKISNITWDYSAGSGKLAGTIGNDASKSLQPFSLDTRSVTSFELANKLWEMIENGYE